MAAGPTVHEQAFEPNLRAIGSARRFVASTAPADVGSEDVARLALLTSELASNAVMHTSAPFIVRVTASPASVRVAVRDVDPAVPAIREPAAGEVTGRGLAIIDATASRWGVEVAADARSKWVWADLDLRRGDR
jgi:anti-sigma regulatory factor (Ser/Thr protein kinase)